MTTAKRCTKGIGILLLDTEGLFGFLNKAKSVQRYKFDRKLVVLFDMSDFVLVNIDKTLSDLLMVTLSKPLKINHGVVFLPEMILILNQNKETNKQVHLQDIDKMSEFGLSKDNVVVLPLAFEAEQNIRTISEPI